MSQQFLPFQHSDYLYFEKNSDRKLTHLDSLFYTKYPLLRSQAEAADRHLLPAKADSKRSEATRKQEKILVGKGEYKCYGKMLAKWGKKITVRAGQGLTQVPKILVSITVLEYQSSRLEFSRTRVSDDLYP